MSRSPRSPELNDEFSEYMDVTQQIPATGKPPAKLRKCI